MYCPKCAIALDENGAITCPYCTSPLDETPAHAHDTAIGDALTLHVRTGGSSEQQKPSCELLDTAFEEIHIDNQRAHASGSKSLPVTALLGALLLLSFIGTGIYYLKYITMHETALQTPPKILTLPSSEAPAPTLKNAPLPEQQSQEDTTHAAQDGLQTKQDLFAHQTEVPDATGNTADSHEQKDVHDITTQQAQAAGAEVPQINIPSAGDTPPITATSQVHPAAMHALPRKNNTDSSGTLPSKQNSSVSASTNSITNFENGSHILLCGSFQSKEKALKQAGKIKAQGYMPVVERADLGSKGIWYRIKIAGFNSKDAAEKVRIALSSKLKLEAIVAKQK
jgi:cell division protein FtsN